MSTACLDQTYGLRLLPAPSTYRTTARSEQGGSHSCCSGCSGSRCPGRQPARSKRRGAKNHRVDSGYNRTTHLSLACCYIQIHTSPSTIPIRFHSCRKVRSRFPSLFLLPLILCHSYFLCTTQRHLYCRFLHIYSFLRRVPPIPILPL